MSASSRTIEHTGEWRVEAHADTLEEIFQEFARVIAGAAGTASGSYAPWEEIDIEARDLDALLVDCANELVGRGEVEGRAYDDLRDIVIHVDARPRLHARLRGRPVTGLRSPLKAATYHGACVSRHGDRWRANLLFDV